MPERGKLEPLRLGEAEAYQSGPGAYTVYDTSTGRGLGDIRVCDDGSFEAAVQGSKSSDVRKTLAEAMQALVDG